MIVRGKHAATVTAIEDPEKRGRIRVTCLALMGDEETELPMWVDPDLEWGWFVVPDVGEVVDIEVSEGSADDEQFGQISIDGLNARWKGRYWGGSDLPEPRPVPEDYTAKNYGKRRGFATPGGHILMFDDTEGSKKISLTWKGKEGEFAYFAQDEDGSVIISNKKGSLLYLNAKDGENTLIDEHGNLFGTSVDGVKVIDKTGNIIELKDGIVQVLGQSVVKIVCKSVEVEAAQAIVDADDVELSSGATEAVLKGTSFLQHYLAHTHPTGTGPSGPLVPTGSEADLLSLKAKVG